MAIFGYVRVSTIEQANGTSPATQEAAVVALGAQQPVFVDEGVSGSVPLNQRPRGAEMLATVRSGDTIIAAKLDRLFRSASDALVTVEALKKAGVNVVLLDMGTTPVTENGAAKLFFGILASIAEFERDRIRERIATGKDAKRANQGHVGGTAPFGYRVVGHGKDALLAPVEAEQDAIALMLTLRADGMSQRKIAAAIAERTGFKVSARLVFRVLNDADRSTADMIAG